MKNDGLNPKLKNAFENLQDVPPRSPLNAARGRANFLEQAAGFRQAVSREANQRHKWWNNIIPLLFQRKENLPMLKPVIAVVLALAIFFGGTSATVYAAQASLPDQALYPVKTWSEDAVLSLADSAQTRSNYALDFADRRVAEMAGLLAAGKPVPQIVETRLQNELDQALELAAGMADTQAIQQMESIRQHAEAQLQTMTRLTSQAPESEEPLLLKAQLRLREQIQLAELGESDMTGFRMQIQQRFQNKSGSGDQTPGTGNNPQGPAPVNPTFTPGQSGPGPVMNQPTVMPGQSGPGPVMNQPTAMPGQSGPGPVMNQPTAMPGQSGSGPVMNQPTAVPGQSGPGPATNQPTAVPGQSGPGPVMEQPTVTPGQIGPGSPMPDQTPQPGGGSGRMP